MPQTPRQLLCAVLLENRGAFMQALETARSGQGKRSACTATGNFNGPRPHNHPMLTLLRASFTKAAHWPTRQPRLVWCRSSGYNNTFVTTTAATDTVPFRAMSSTSPASPDAPKASEATELLPNQLHGCLDGLWEQDPDKLRAYLAGGDCGDAGFCRGLCATSLSDAGDAERRFSAEPGRYVLYVSAGCPFAARPWMVSCTLGLVDTGVLRIVRVFPGNAVDGWFMHPVSEQERQICRDFQCEDTHDRDDIVFKANGWTHLREMYLASNPKFSGTVSVPVLYDTVRKEIVSNQSLDIAAMLAEHMAPLVPEDKRPGLVVTAEGLFGAPGSERREEVHRFGAELHATVNIKPYRIHMAPSQAAFDANTAEWFATLRALDEKLKGQPWVLPGDAPSFCDLQLFATLARWEIVYRHLFRIQEYRLEDFPRLFGLVRRVYALPGLARCLDPANVSRNYYLSHSLKARQGPGAPKPLKWFTDSLQAALPAAAAAAGRDEGDGAAAAV